MSRTVFCKPEIIIIKRGEEIDEDRFSTSKARQRNKAKGITKGED